VTFTWDPKKAASNRKKHRVGFEEALTAFEDRHALYEADEHHADRGVLIGVSASLRVLFVVHVKLLDTGETRIISARKATRAEKRRYDAALS
jgi:uncharacterized DUF497 family protein